MADKKPSLQSFIRPHLGAFANVAVSLFFVTLIGMNWPFLFRIVIDEVLIRHSAEMAVFCIIAYPVVYAFEKYLQYLWRLSDAHVGHHFLNDIRSAIFASVLATDSKTKSLETTGNISLTIDRDVDQVYPFVTEHTISVAINLLRMVIAVVYLLYLNPLLGGVVILLIPLNLITSEFLASRIKVQRSRTRDVQADLESWSSEILAGLREIVILGSLSQARARMLDYIRRIAGLEDEEAKVTGTVSSAAVLLGYFSDICIYAGAALGVSQGTLSLGSFVSMLVYYEWGKVFFKRISQFFLNRHKNDVAIERIFRLLSLETEQSGNRVFETGDITIDGVKLSNNGTVVLDSLVFKIPLASKIALVGESGSGKSTIADLLLGLRKPDEGIVKVNGTDISCLDLRQLRSNIAIVRQHPLFFPGTIRENLCLGLKAPVSDDEIYRSLEISGVLDVVLQSGSGLEGSVRPGFGFSGGEFQRLAIARAILRKATTLIFDEATSQLDPDLEREVMSRLCERLHGRTLVFITYRQISLEFADTVLYLNNGKIVASGSHSWLSEHVPEYRKFCGRS